MIPDIQTLYAVIDATWPAAAISAVGPFTIRDGQDGGQRVSATTGKEPFTTPDIQAAEHAMRDLNQPLLFMIREGDDALDSTLAEHGYDIVDPVNLYACPIEFLTSERPPRTASFDIWEPLAIQRDIWAAGGIGPGRIRVMERAQAPKTSLFGRDANRPSATGFVAIHNGVAMVHALEVLSRHRRAGQGRYLTQAAALWAADHSATHMSVLCTVANVAANGLYSSLGMTLVGQYHYRKLLKDTPE